MGQKTAGMTKRKAPKPRSPQRAGKTTNGTNEVDAFLAALEHPLKPQVQALRKAILAVDDRITEQVKWNAPSFRTAKDYVCTFSLRPGKPLLLIFHNPLIPRIQSTIFDGDFKDRRLVTFADAQNVKAKTPEVRRVVAALLKEMDT